MKFKLLALALLTALFANAQIKYYKVQNGTKTPLQPGEEVKIRLNDQMIPDINILAEVDYKTFKTKYKYDNILLNLMSKTQSEEVYRYYSFTIDSELNSKKYGTATILKFYLFNTMDVQKDPANMYFLEEKQTPAMGERKLSFQFNGRYRTKTEEYLDDNYVWQKRDVFAKAEGLDVGTSPVITFILTEATQLDESYKALIKQGYGTRGNILGLNTINDKIKDATRYVAAFEASIPVVGTVQTYAALAEAMKQIADSKYNQITNESDKKKAIELLEQWNKEYVHLMLRDKSKDLLKTINKDVKAASGTDAKFEVIKRLNP